MISVIFLRFIYVVACGSSPFFCWIFYIYHILLNNNIPYSAKYTIYHGFFLHFPIDGIWIASSVWLWWRKLLWTFLCKYAAAKSLQSCPTLGDPIDGSPPGSPVPGILQARILEWVAISFSSAWKWKVKVKSLSHVRLFTTPWTAAYQTPPSVGFSRQVYLWTNTHYSQIYT